MRRKVHFDDYPIRDRDQEMAVAMRRRWMEDDLLPARHRDSSWGKDDWLEKEDWKDWPVDWPKPRDMMSKFYRDTDQWWRDWPSDWPRMDAVMPRVSTQLDRIDRNWRNDPFWMDLYPRWAEPIFKEGIDVNSSIVNDDRKFAVELDCYQFRPEEIQVKTLDDTLLIEGRHEDVKDSDNYTKMHFVRKYQIPPDVESHAVQSNIDAKGRLIVEAPRRHNALGGRERMIPIEGPSSRAGSSPRYTAPTSPIIRQRHDSGFSANGFSSRSTNSPLQVNTDQGREVPIMHTGRDSRDTHTRENSRNSPGSRDGYSTQSYSYHRSESRNRLSPHDVTQSNENRAYGLSPGGPSPRAPSADGRYRTSSPRVDTNFDNNTSAEQRSPGRGVFNELREKFEKGRARFQSTSLPRRFRSQSRGDYREENSRSHSRSREGYGTENRRETGGYGGFESNERRENGYSSDSRNNTLPYRVDSPASTTTGILRNAGGDREPRPGSRTESLRSVQILRKTFG